MKPQKQLNSGPGKNLLTFRTPTPQAWGWRGSTHSRLRKLKTIRPPAGMIGLPYLSPVEGNDEGRQQFPPKLSGLHCIWGERDKIGLKKAASSCVKVGKKSGRSGGCCLRVPYIHPWGQGPGERQALGLATPFNQTFFSTSENKVSLCMRLTSPVAF